MTRDQINLYIEPLLSLVPPTAEEPAKAIRYQLIEEAISCDDLSELIRQWMVVHDLTQEVALSLRTWFQLSYARLGQILSLTSKEVSQLIRTLRTQQLPSYPPVSKSLDREAIAGLSCFMVEQSLSAWLDSEIQDFRIVENVRHHLDQCPDCYERLQSYRQLHEKILQQRKHWPAVTDLEWKDALRDMANRRKKFIRAGLIYSAVVVAIGLIVFGIVWSRPEETPNIYEMGR